MEIVTKQKKKKHHKLKNGRFVETIIINKMFVWVCIYAYVCWYTYIQLKKKNYTFIFTNINSLKI